MRAKRINRLALMTLALVGGLGLFAAGCQDEGSINPFEPTALPNAFLQSFSVFPTTLGLGGRTATMTAYVVDAEGNPVEGVDVAFITDIGTVDESAVSDGSGIASATFTSGSQKGTATVIASIGSVQFQASILIGANELTLERSTALADGRTEILVGASVFRPDGSAAQRAFVTFSSTAGTIQASALTDSSGYVGVKLTAPASESDIQAEVVCSVEGSEIDPTGAFGVPPDEEQTVGIGIIAFRGITLSVSTKKSQIVASGSDSTEVLCSVTETVSKIPVTNMDVSFATDLGAISSPERTSGSGIATAKIWSDIYPGTVNIVASIETLKDSTTMQFTPLTLTPLKATPRSILRSGDKSVISTKLLNQNNNPVEGMTVTFSTDMGVIPGEGITDSLGVVDVELTSGDSVGTATVFARFGSLETSTVVQFTNPVVEPIRLENLWWEPLPIADGVSGTYVKTRMLNSTNNPVVGRVVEFATDLGVIAESDTTDSLGIVKAWLYGIEDLDTVFAHVTASHGSLTVEADVPFYPPGSQTPVAMTLTSARNDVQVSGSSGLESVVLTATAFDASGDTVLSGSDVTFRIISSPGGGEFLVWPDSGQGSEVTVPIKNNSARVTLNAGTISGIVALQAETQGNVIAYAEVGITAGPPAYATVAIDSIVSVVSGGGVFAWKVACLVTDKYSNPVINGTPVFLTLHEDTCGTGNAPSGLSISGNVTTFNVPSCQALQPEPGIAYACIIGPHRLFSEFPSFGIEARSGSNNKLGCLNIDHGSANNEPAAIALRSVSDSVLSVKGVGGDEASVLQFEVTDARGYPLSSANAVDVDFEIVAQPGGVIVEPMTVRTNVAGLVNVTVRSGTSAGVVKLRASTGAIESSVASITITGGPPDAAHFSVATSPVNIPGLLLLGQEATLTAFVFDKFSNPVPVGTAVYFTTNFGGILGSGQTGPTGQAQVTLFSADPLPTCGDGGLVTVTASTIGEDNSTIQTSTDVLFSGSTMISANPSTFAIGPGGFQDIIVTVSDQCGNPLVAGTTIDISTSGGSLVGNVSYTMPDTRSSSFTQFWVRLSDDEAAEPDSNAPPPENHSIEVEVVSPNGNASQVIFGTID